MDAPAFQAGPTGLIRRRPVAVAAFVSLATVEFLLPLLVLLALFLGTSGLVLATLVGDSPLHRTAARLTSIGVGLAVGPIAFLALVVTVALF